MTAAPDRTDTALRVVLLDTIPSWGGGEKWCLDAATALRARGHFVAIACAESSALEHRSRDAGIDTWPFPPGRWRTLGSGMRLARRLRDERIDVVIANIGHDVRVGAIACARSRAQLVQRRGIARAIKRDPLSRWIYRHSVRRVIANCEAIRDEMLGMGDVIGAERFVVIPNGIDVAQAGDRARGRAKLGIASDATVAIAVGRLAPMKGHEHLLRAWCEVRARAPHAVLVFAGDGEIRAELETLARELDIGASVRFAGFVRDLADFYAAADVFTLASVRDEGCNNALLEAMARGLPAVVTRCGGLPESVVDDVTGLVVDLADPKTLATALLRLLTDPALRQTLGDAALARAREHYTTARVTDQLEHLLREVRSET